MCVFLSVQVLEHAMGLPGERTRLAPQQRARMTRRVIEPQQHERVSIYLLLAQCLSKLSKQPDAPEAKKVGNTFNQDLPL